MKLFIFSDTHDRVSKITLIRQAIINEKPNIIIHLGDFVSPFFVNQLFQNIKKEANVERIILVKGNNDGDIDFLTSVCSKLDIKLYTEYFSEKIENKNILAFHKPDFVDQLAKSGEFDYIFYGHTHKKIIKKINSTIIANPGTAAGYLADESTYITLELLSGNIEFHSL
jgi:putative phosphoesterase